MFEYPCKVRMYDTDMAGVLYFGNQYRFMHDGFESLMGQEGFTFQSLMRDETFMFVIAHCESDYLAPLYAGDDLVVRLHCCSIGTTSFTISYALFKSDHLVGKGKTVHVCLDQETRSKIELPIKIRSILKTYSS